MRTGSASFSSAPDLWTVRDRTEEARDARPRAGAMRMNFALTFSEVCRVTVQLM